jgi:hypothetical protein
LPGGRYEFWVFKHELYEEIESDALVLFRKNYGRIPLANRKREASVQKHSYDETLYQVAEPDHRYWWAMRPTRPEVTEYFEKGAGPGEQDET